VEDRKRNNTILFIAIVLAYFYLSGYSKDIKPSPKPPVINPVNPLPMPIPNPLPIPTPRPNPAPCPNVGEGVEEAEEEYVPEDKVEPGPYVPEQEYAPEEKLQPKPDYVPEDKVQPQPKPQPQPRTGYWQTRVVNRRVTYTVRGRTYYRIVPYQYRVWIDVQN
jgi:hypothetical protein